MGEAALWGRFVCRSVLASPGPQHIDGRCQDLAAMACLAGAAADRHSSCKASGGSHHLGAARALVGVVVMGEPAHWEGPAAAGQRHSRSLCWLCRSLATGSKQAYGCRQVVGTQAFLAAKGSRCWRRLASAAWMVWIGLCESLGSRLLLFESSWFQLLM